MKIMIFSHKTCHLKNAQELQNKFAGIHEIVIYTKKEELTEECVRAFAPDYVFFPHWSYIIPASIYERYVCIVFHMTDLPFGRGGSPMQNLIARGYSETKVSAIRVAAGIDTGDIYMKESLSLSGTADEILNRVSNLIFDRMLPRFLTEKLVPSMQEGPVTTFKRRTMADGEIKETFSPEKIYDYIRMLDGEGYPRAYICFGKYKLELEEAQLENGQVSAKIRFVEEKEK